jgi:hypothetical protein
MTAVIWSRLPEASLTPTMFGIWARRASVSVSTLTAVRPLDVVDDQREVRNRLRDGAVVLVEALLGRLVVVGRHDERAGRAGVRHVARHLDHVGGRVRAGPGDDGDPAARLLDDDLDDPLLLGVRKRRRLARRPAGD